MIFNDFNNLLSVALARIEGRCTTLQHFGENMGLINKVDMVCLSPVGYGV